jgi:preprotein translocase subunit SecB
MKPAPLQLLDYWASSLHMDACPDYDPKAETQLDLESIEVQHNVKQLDTQDSDYLGSQWLVSLSIEQTPCKSANIPYTFAVTIQGVVLALPGGLAGEQTERAIKANGPAMLYGAAREMIRAATGRGPHRAVIIPSTNFLPPIQPAEAAAARTPVKRKSTKASATLKSPESKPSTDT